jgi:RecA/RadA recombinase
MSLLNKLKKNSTLKHTEILSESDLYSLKDVITTDIPALNIALSGSINGGYGPGLTVFAGPSKHFKSLFTLILAKAYLDKYPDGVMLMYDSEFGTPRTYFESIGIDPARVLHTPITDIEQLKFDLTAQLNNIERGEHVFIAIDSVGNLASMKEVEDAENQKSAADMSRAKAMKSLFRIVTPHLTLKNIPMVVVNHTYQTLEIYSRAVVSGGTGIYYSSDNIFIVGRQQEKEGTDVVGYNFVINVEKSRHSKEKSKIPITVKHEGGISKWSGLLDIALETGHVVVASKGWYSRVNMVTGEVEDKKWRAKDTDTSSFWSNIIACPTFDQAIRAKYQSATGKLIQGDFDEG